MKELYQYWGRVMKYNPDPDHSFVMLKDTKTGELYETDAVSAMLAEQGLTHEDDEFTVTIGENENGKIEAVIAKLEPRVPTAEELAQINKEVDEKLNGDIPPCFDI